MLLLKISYGELHTEHVLSAATQCSQTFMHEFLNDLTEFAFLITGSVLRHGGCQNLIRQEVRGKEMRIGKQGGVKARALSSQRNCGELFFVA